MSPQTRVRPANVGKLLVLDRESGSTFETESADLPGQLSRGDTLVVNDSATLPAAIWTTLRSERVELRLVRRDPTQPTSFWAVLFGSGDHHQPTESRGQPIPVTVGDALVAEGLVFQVLEVDPASPRWVKVHLASPQSTIDAIVHAGVPIQYAYMKDELSLWDVQTAFASKPWSFEMPSASRAVTLPVVRELRRQGVSVVALTHGAGITSTGDPELDARLPLPEPYEIGEEVVAAVTSTRRRGGRVIACGTSVVRALEGSAHTNGGLVAGRGETEWLGARGVALSIVDGILTGIHERGESHFDLLEAFAPGPWLDAAVAKVGRLGFVGHEFGDAMLIA